MSSWFWKRPRRDVVCKVSTAPASPKYDFFVRPSLVRAFFLCLAVLCTLVANGQVTTDPYYLKRMKDTLFLTIGSEIVGRLKNAKLGVVTFDPYDANDITVQLRRLNTISTRDRVFRIETTKNRILFGTISPGPEQRTILVKNWLDSVVIDLLDVSVLYPYETGILQRIDGYVGLGFSYTRSSGFGRLNFDGAIRYVTEKNELTSTLSGIYSIYDTAFSRDKEEVYIKHNYFFSGYWFLTGFVAYQRNIALSLERRFQEGVGIGNKFLTSKRVYTWARGGVVLNQERSTENVSTGTLTELFGQLEFNFFRFEIPKIQAMLSNAAYYSLSQKGRFRDDAKLTFTWELLKDFDLSVEFYSNYDSQPPAEGGLDFDYGAIIGVRVDF